MHTAGLRVIAPKLQTLATLELYKAHWKSSDLEEVVKLFPSINYLLIDGELKSTRVSVSSGACRATNPFYQLLLCLSYLLRFSAMAIPYVKANDRLRASEK